MTALVVATGAALAQEPAGAVRHLDLAAWYDGPRSDLAPLMDLVGAFQQQNPGVLGHLYPRPTLTAAGWLQRWCGPEAANAPDLVVINAEWLPYFRAYLEPLDDLAATPAAQALLPPARDLFTLEGHLLAVPWNLGARVLLVRSDLLTEKQLSAPRTWEEVGAVAAALHDPPRRWGLGLPGAEGGGGPLLLQELLWAMGGSLYSPEGALTLTGDSVAQALGRYGELARSAPPEVLSWPQTELEVLFAEGRLGMLVTDTWLARRWSQRTDVPTFTVLPLPGGETPSGHLLGDGLALLKSSPDRDLGRAFLRMLLTAPAQGKLAQMGGLPAHPEALADLAADPLLAAVLPTLPSARVINDPRAPDLARALQLALFLSVSGRRPPAEALREAAALLSGRQQPPSGAPPGAPESAAPSEAPATGGDG